jgi:phytoene synthase
MQNDFEHCAALVREADRDRYLATLFAPAAHRDALFALYAFNAEIARVREVAREPMPGEIRLQWWREVLAGERVGEAAANPVAAALRTTLDRHEIAADRLITLIDAHGFDLYDDPMAALAELESYAGNTLGTLLTIAAEILGAQAEINEPLIRHASAAMTIAASLVRFGHDAAYRKLFVPLDVLARHQVNREDIFSGLSSEALRAALGEMRGFARRHLAVAQAEFKSNDVAALPALLPAAIVGPTLRRMERPGYDPFQPELLAPWRRQWLLWRAARSPSRIFAS